MSNNGNKRGFAEHIADWPLSKLFQQERHLTHDALNNPLEVYALMRQLYVVQERIASLRPNRWHNVGVIE